MTRRTDTKKIVGRIWLGAAFLFFPAQAVMHAIGRPDLAEWMLLVAFLLILARIIYVSFINTKAVTAPTSAMSSNVNALILGQTYNGPMVPQHHHQHTSSVVYDPPSQHLPGPSEPANS